MSVNTKTAYPRLDTLTITAGNAIPVKIIVSQPSSEFLYFLNSSPVNLSFTRAGNSSNITISTDAPGWNINSESDWLEISQLTGVEGNSVVTITASENIGTEQRNTTLSVNAEFAPPLQISVTQQGEYYPGYNTSPAEPDASGMSSMANVLAAKIHLGWNLGNSLEAIGGETAWGNPAVTKGFIDFVKQNGFNAVRLPCSWNQYMSDASTAQLKAEWLDRIKEVVQYCVDDDMYVILNIHWDGGWLENNCTEAKKEANNAKQKAFWEQIATHLRDFDEHLLFASANEPNVDNAGQMAVLKSYHQTFIDAVRSTGGRNAFRNLVIQGPSTDIEKTLDLMISLPTDNIPNRMMVEVHYYTPWNFCGLTADADWGKMFYYWGEGYHSLTDPERNATWGEEDFVNTAFSGMKSRFVDQGIPVVLGEFSVVRRSSLTGDDLVNHLASRAYFLKYVTQQAIANGMLPFYWDNGGMDNNACGLFNRNNKTVFDQQALDALIEGGGK
ncbi:MAG: dihydroxy-acid dehydratase [Bacteroidetes bacterium CG18_big_fil_WC_8_21_14_2_50_41_14]|nr:MAG: dihydroxy-acid dehydratase [Bacteroidetes bacterium CG18_big_fil_WC_8_21_14_2_50_41_14]PJB55181.1 MAG: dihydroxy-acid dehydratase [Bacteroidetes bacterium CG_4_9_14_3_um_filter_41_19]